MDTVNQFPREGLVRLPQILNYLSIGKTAWWAGVKAGRYAQPVKLGGVTAWRASDIRALAGESGGDDV